jgi:hypothetical protein
MTFRARGPRGIFGRGKAGIALTILSPGTQTDQWFEPAADVLLTFEGSDSQYVHGAFVGESISGLALVACHLRDLDRFGDGHAVQLSKPHLGR